MNPFRRPAALPLLALLLAAPNAPAADSDTPAPETAPAVPVVTTAELLAIADQYQREIERLEAEQGPLAARLGEQLQSQGRVYQQLQDHTRAVEALKRAYHIKRVNDGLHDLGQVPILQNIIESNIALQDWPAVNQNFDQLLWIYRRNYEEGDQALLAIYDQVGRWKIQAYREGLLDGDDYNTISEAAYLFTKTIELTEEKVGENDPRLVDLLYGHALANYHAMIEYANRPLDQYVNRQATGTVTYIQRCVPVRLPNGRVSTQCYAVPVMNVGAYTRAQDEKDLDVERRFLAARKSLQRIVAIHEAHPEIPAQDRAEALAHLGDWFMLRGSTGTAMEHYQKAWQLLGTLPDGGSRQEAMFGVPVALPALRLSLPSIDRRLAPEDPAGYITITYDVTKSGRVRNAVVSDNGAGAETPARRKALESLRSSKFRPRLENGVAVDTVGAVKRYPIKK